jgi:hypothetical protein
MSLERFREKVAVVVTYDSFPNVDCEARQTCAPNFDVILWSLSQSHFHRATSEIVSFMAEPISEALKCEYELVHFTEFQFDSIAPSVWDRQRLQHFRELLPPIHIILLTETRVEIKALFTKNV